MTHSFGCRHQGGCNNGSAGVLTAQAKTKLKRPHQSLRTPPYVGEHRDVYMSPIKEPNLFRVKKSGSATSIRSGSIGRSEMRALVELGAWGIKIDKILPIARL